jgi:hypothetical protein
MRPTAGANAARVALFMMLASCTGCSGNEEPIDTGLTGLVLRGPITPVCMENVPCDAPFAATFVVTRSGRGVATFASSSDGRFTVLLAPGSYRIVPTAAAPLLNPTAQGQDVVVGTAGLTSDTLFFDTGIR